MLQHKVCVLLCSMICTMNMGDFDADVMLFVAALQVMNVCQFFIVSFL